MNLKDVGTAIRTRRRNLQINQRELADLADVNINTVVSIERGIGNPKIETLLSVCDVLGLQLSVIIKE